MGSRVRVVSYNIHSSRDDLSALASVVRGLRPDILIMQEGPRRWRWRTKCAALAHSFGLVVAGGGLPALGNVVLTSLRVRVTGTRCERYPLTPGRHMRGAVFVSVAVEDAVATVVGSHLSTDDAERPAQARLLRAGLAGLSGPVVLGADLNDVPGSVSWEIVHEGLRPAVGALTFPSGGPDRQIDTVAVGGGVRLEGATVETGPLTRRASDHLPIVADLTLP